MTLHPNYHQYGSPRDYNFALLQLLNFFSEFNDSFRLEHFWDQLRNILIW